MVRSAFISACKLAVMSRFAELCDCRTFVANVLEMRASLSRLGEIVQGDIPEVWPEAPGTTFAWTAGWSALHVAAKFADTIDRATFDTNEVLVSRGETALFGPSSIDLLPVDPTPDPRLVAWQERMNVELRTKTLPPLPAWPHWDISRDMESHLYKLIAEYEQASKSADHGTATDDRQTFMPAAWFHTQCGIPRDRLRTAMRWGRIKAEKVGHRYYYSVRDARRCWPEDAIPLPPKLD